MPLGKRTEFGNSRYVGFQTPFTLSTDVTLKEVERAGFDFIITPLQRPIRGVTQREFVPDDLTPISGETGNQIVGQVTTDEGALEQQIEWAMHCGIHAVVISLTPKSHDLVHIARVVNSKLEGSVSNMAYWIHIKLNDEEEDPWETWNQLRCLCHHHFLLGVLLELTEDLPRPQQITRFYGEPVRAMLIPTNCFVTNKKGFPVLSKQHRFLAERLLSTNVQLVLAGDNGIHDSASKNNADDSAVSSLMPLENMTLYFEYLCYLFRSLPTLTEDQILSRQYFDQLQIPLEPLKDNLDAHTYDVFEKDAPKYSAYEEAIHGALLDWPQEERGKSVVIMVVGAGRGPLVRASVRAAKDCARKVHIYAIEKNPYAVIDLRIRATEWQWGDTVTIVPHDMRTWDAPEKADILVSELLGSFGDNELSPECLDGAQRFLKEGGISIPASYTSFCAPITASKAYSYAMSYKDRKNLETSYVVKLSNHDLLSSPLPVFTFSHPNRNHPIDNSRYAKLQFRRDGDAPACMMHGLVGYFDTVLHGSVKLSTVPERHTEDMESWFSMFFPLTSPIYVPKGPITIDVHFWRLVEQRQVWYEWAITSPETTIIHNTNGHAISVGR